MDRLSQRARAYLDAYAERQPAPPAIPPMRAAQRSASPWRWIVPMLGIAAVAIAGWGANRVTAVEVADAKRFEAAPDRVESPAIEAATEAKRPVPRRREPVAMARDPEPIAVAAPEPIAVAAPEPRRRARAAIAPASTLRHELALLDAAKASLRAGDGTAARRSLEQHANRFPDGLLAPERRRLTKRIDAETEARACVHSSCVRSDDKQESSR